MLKLAIFPLEIRKQNAFPINRFIPIDSCKINKFIWIKTLYEQLFFLNIATESLNHFTLHIFIIKHFIHIANSFSTAAIANITPIIAAATPKAPISSWKKLRYLSSECGLYYIYT